MSPGLFGFRPSRRGLIWLRSALALIGLALFLAISATAQGVLPVPPLGARVIDTSGTLDAAQQQALEAKLAAFEATKGSQVVVYLLPTTQPEDIASFANRVANEWKIGRRAVGRARCGLCGKGACAALHAPLPKAAVQCNQAHNVAAVARIALAPGGVAAGVISRKKPDVARCDVHA